MPLSFQPAAMDRRARVAAIALFVLVAAYCVFVEIRVAGSKKRRIDLDVNLHAAWAVRAGENPYTITNERGWHYNLPPLLAILLVPVAEQPPGAEQTGDAPLLLTLAIWNVVGLVALGASVHALASAAVPRFAAGTARWWAPRLIPIAACVPAIGITLNRGQVNLFLTALLIFSIAAALRGRKFIAGGWLAAAVCLKIIPAYLILHPLWMRDRRWLAGTVLGLIIGLGLIPALVFSPQRAGELYLDLARSVMLPGLNLGADGTRSEELIDLYASNSQSFQVLFHHLLYSKSAEIPGWLRLAHWLAGGSMTLLTLLTGRTKPSTPTRSIIRFGALAVLMVAISPASHDHYFCVNAILILGLVTARLEGNSPFANWSLAVVLTVYFAACALPMIPDLRVLRDLRSPLIGSLVLWLAGIATLRGGKRSLQFETSPDVPHGDGSVRTPGFGNPLQFRGLRKLRQP
jgi:hypothetical protein